MKICYGVCVLVWIAFLICIAYVDQKTMEIPDWMNAAVLLTGVLSTLFSSQPSLESRIGGIFVVSIPMFFVAWLFPGGFGGGDIKLMAAAGVFLGWERTLLAGVIAILAGGLYSVFLLVGKKVDRKTCFAFGPFLCLGLLVAFLVGDRVLAWYL